MERIKSLYVSTAAGQSGVLFKDAQHQFLYDPDLLVSEDRRREVSLIMPLRTDPWRTNPMLPVFQTFLPEGYLKDRIETKFGKLIKMDDMALLAMSGGNSIGRLQVSVSKDRPSDASGVESLHEIMSDQRGRDLFEYLSDKYLIGTAIAGVQPKVVVPVESQAEAVDDALRNKGSLGDRTTLRVKQVIVKIDGGEYPGVSENEYHCLSIAAKCTGLLDVPKFTLSNDLRRLAIERFDRGRSGQYLGFEDMVALQGRVNREKYDGSYEMVAKTIKDTCSPSLLRSSLLHFYTSIVLAVVLRNGDAHLKNFGMLYTDPATDDCRLSPIFDQVCTTAYIEKDLMALTLNKSKSWPSRATLEKFGSQTCEIRSPGDVIDQVLDAVAEYRPDIQGPVWTDLQKIFSGNSSFLSLKFFPMPGVRPK